MSSSPISSLRPSLPPIWPLSRRRSAILLRLSLILPACLFVVASTSTIPIQTQIQTQTPETRYLPVSALSLDYLSIETSFLVYSSMNALETQQDSTYSFPFYFSSGHSECSSWRVVKTISLRETECAILENSGLRWLILAFRGTSSLTDALTDSRAWMTPCRLGPASSRTSCGYVHNGFLRAYNFVADEIRSFLLSFQKAHNGEYSLLITGHSLGGALAALATVDLRLHDLFGTLVTFGAPRTGDLEFVQQLRNHSIRAYVAVDSISHVRDPVSTVPPLWIGYVDNNVADDPAAKVHNPILLATNLSSPYFDYHLDLHHIATYQELLRQHLFSRSKWLSSSSPDNDDDHGGYSSNSEASFGSGMGDMAPKTSPTVQQRTNSRKSCGTLCSDVGRVEVYSYELLPVDGCLLQSHRHGGNYQLNISVSSADGNNYHSQQKTNDGGDANSKTDRRLDLFSVCVFNASHIQYYRYSSSSDPAVTCGGTAHAMMASEVSTEDKFLHLELELEDIGLETYYIIFENKNKGYTQFAQLVYSVHFLEPPSVPSAVLPPAAVRSASQEQERAVKGEEEEQPVATVICRSTLGSGSGSSQQSHLDLRWREPVFAGRPARLAKYAVSLFGRPKIATWRADEVQHVNTTDASPQLLGILLGGEFPCRHAKQLPFSHVEIAAYNPTGKGAMRRFSLDNYRLVLEERGSGADAAEETVDDRDAVGQAGFVDSPAQTALLVLFCGGVIAAVSGGVMWVWKRTPPRSAADSAVAVGGGYQSVGTWDDGDHEQTGRRSIGGVYYQYDENMAVHHSLGAVRWPDATTVAVATDAAAAGAAGAGAVAGEIAAGEPRDHPISSDAADDVYYPL